MAVDLALDRVTGDLIASPSNDVTLVSGLAEVEQRMRTYLRVLLGSYELDPDLGSTLTRLTRLPINMAVAQLPLVAREALAKMPDIRVEDVTAWVSEDDPRKVDFNVLYQVVDDSATGDDVLFSDSLVVVA